MTEEVKQAAKQAATAVLKAAGYPAENIRLAFTALDEGELTPTTNPAQVLGRAVKPKEAAKALNVSTKTIGRRVADGHLKGVYSGKGENRRMIAVTVASINAFLEGGEGKEVC